MVKPHFFWLPDLCNINTDDGILGIGIGAVIYSWSDLCVSHVNMCVCVCADTCWHLRRLDWCEEVGEPLMDEVRGKKLKVQYENIV